MKRTELKKSASFKNVFTLLQKLNLTPFELGLMMSLITKMMKHSRYDTKAKDYYLTYDPKSRVTSEKDSWPKLQKAFNDFKKKGYIKVETQKGQQPKLFFTFVKIVK
ncbi:hypothetical protein HGK75_03830 [uncultured bacterium]|uniref:hypothetical protein n=1 Tax=Acetilactobacillus jinshanensis TaxID=1720083 RepID=UPI00218C4D6D|nr:hypothetical protein HGK75_03830 [uncultured bacterium]